MIARKEETRVLLRAWQEGSDRARDNLIERLYPELVQIAAARLRREQSSSLSTGDLVNQAILRIVEAETLSMVDRAHFMALSSRLMRNILVDHARAKLSAKRNHAKVELTTRIDDGRPIDLLALETAMLRLRALDVQLMELVEMRYFGGMTTADVAVVLGVSEPTVKRRWQVARAWLLDALSHPIESE